MPFDENPEEGGGGGGGHNPHDPQGLKIIAQLTGQNLELNADANGLCVFHCYLAAAAHFIDRMLEASEHASNGEHPEDADKLKREVARLFRNGIEALMKTDGKEADQ